MISGLMLPADYASDARYFNETTGSCPPAKYGTWDEERQVDQRQLLSAGHNIFPD